MHSDQPILSDPLKLDITRGQLWCGGQQLTLRPQAFAVLRYLAEHPNLLISKEELLREVWQGRYVSASTIRGCIREIRIVLQDSSQNARFIETVGRKGYRFIAHPYEGSNPAPATDRDDERLIVGRSHEFDQLNRCLARSVAGERQLILVSGEAGLGKTSLADLFIREAQKDHEILVGRGRCIDQYGHSEAYLPVMDWLCDLAQSDTQEAVLSAMHRHAPSWLAQLTMFPDAPERERLQQLLPGVTRARMWQELNHLLRVLAETRPLLLLIEDLHWCDTSTLELLDYLAQRQEPARWLILGTYRQTEAGMQKHRLRDLLIEWQARGCCRELALAPLTIDDVDAWLHSSLAGTIAPETAFRLHHLTGGNALFLKNIVIYLRQQELLVYSAEAWRLTVLEDNLRVIPAQLQQLIIRRFEQLPEPVQKLLEVASICGETFSTAALAAGLSADPEQIEELCAQLTRPGSLISELDPVVWPDKTLSGCYRFRHALYRQVIYEHLGQVRQSRLHRHVAARLEAGYGNRVSEIAGALALHFEKGRDNPRAVRYYQLAARTAADRHALHEVLLHSRAGLRLLAMLPQTAQTLAAQLDMLILLGTAQIMSQGYASADVNDTFTQAEQLCRQIDDRQRLTLILMVQRSFYYTRGNMHLSGHYVQQLLELAHEQQMPLQLTAAHLAAGNNLLFKGELSQACDYLDQSSGRFNLPLRLDYVANFGHDANVACHILRARTLRLLGYHNQAQRDNDAALSLARALEHPFSLALALTFAIEHYHSRGDLATLAHHLDELLNYCDQYGFSILASRAQIFQGWLRAKRGEHDAGLHQLEQALNALLESGNNLHKQYCLLLQVDLYRDLQRYSEARRLVEQSLNEVLDNAMYIYQPELLRLRGELMLAETPQHSAAAERWLQEAVEISRRQQARTSELRATVSLGRLWQSQGKPEQAHRAVKSLYDQFSEGFDTADLRNARTLLEGTISRPFDAAPLTLECCFGKQIKLQIL